MSRPRQSPRRKPAPSSPKRSAHADPKARVFWPKRLFDGMSGAVLAGSHGFAVGALSVSVAAFAHAMGLLHLTGPIGDRVIGLVLAGLMMAILWAAVWFVSQLAADAATRLRLYATGARSDAVHPVLRFVGRPWIAPAAVVILVLSLTPKTESLALHRILFPFEILIVSGALSGLLAGLGLYFSRAAQPNGRRPILATASFAGSIVLAIGVGGWAMLPGSRMGSSPIPRSNEVAFPTLTLPDPSAPGPHEVLAATYGSGTNRHLPEFGRAATWFTNPVDASRALHPRQGIAALYGRMLWGYDASALPINGRVWFPEDGDGPLPLVLILHGNHEAGKPSDRGFAYLGEHLASRGMIAVAIDYNYLNTDPLYNYRGEEIPVRAWVTLAHLDQFRRWNAAEDHPLAGRVDLERVALIGHSRGGAAAVLAASMNLAGDTRVNGMPSIEGGFGIRAMIGLAPTDAWNVHDLWDIDYLVLQGAHDAGLPAYWGLSTYHRIRFSGKGNHLKAALFSHRANHSRFNSVWGDDDVGPASWMLDRGSILSVAEQQRLAKTVVGAFLARSLFGQTQYDAFIRDPRAGRHWLPDDVVQSKWASSARVLAVDFADCGASAFADGFDSMLCVDPLLRDHSPQGQFMASLAWSRTALLLFRVQQGIANRIPPDGSLTFSLLPASTMPVLDGLIELRDESGESAVVWFADIGPLDSAIAARHWKLEFLGQRYDPSPVPPLPAEHFLPTYAVPLHRFTEANPQFDLARIATIGFRLEGHGAVFLDNIGFEPPWIQ